MNDVKIIIDKILEEAEKETQNILAEGKKEADAIIKEAEGKAYKEKEVFRKRAEEEARKVHAKEVSGAEMEAKKAILAEKQNILAEVIAEAKKRLENLPDAEYVKVVGSMLDKLDASKGKEILVSAKDKDRLKDIIEEKGLILSAETREIDGGFIVRNGDIEYNYSFEAIIMVDKEEIQLIAAKILF